jgi:hypothetical protein
MICVWIRVVVGLDFGRFWPRRRIAARSIRRRNGLLMWEMTGWRRRYHLLQRKRQTLDFVPFSLIVHSSLSSPVFCLKIATLLSPPGLDSLQLFFPVGSFAPELLN